MNLEQISLEQIKERLVEILVTMENCGDEHSLAKVEAERRINELIGDLDETV